GEWSAAQTIWRLRSLDFEHWAGDRLVPWGPVPADLVHATQWLTNMLSNLGPEYSDRISVDQLAALRCHLSARDVESSPYLVAEVIKALASLGDGGAYPFVWALCGDEVLEPVRGIARRLLPEFKLAFEESSSNGALLRPAGSLEDEQRLLRVPSHDC